MLDKSRESRVYRETMAEIHLEDVSRLYGRSTQSDSALLRKNEETELSDAGPIAALDRVNLTIPDGKTCAVMGPSGCGKSTLLRIVAGSDLDYTGEVYYDGQNVRDVPPRDRYIGMVFQNYALYPHFYGHDNLKFFFWVRNTPDKEAEERIRITARLMGIGFNQLLPRKPGTLSGGQQQRLAIARALVRNPKLFLLDEPLSNLDAKLRVQTRVEIKRLLNRFAITTIYVTHDQEEAITLGDLIAVMRAGRIEQVGSHHELYTAPANTFVAGFLGVHPMNLIDGLITETGTLRVAGIHVLMPPAVQAQCKTGQNIIIRRAARSAEACLGRCHAPRWRCLSHR